jgi:biotin transport system permease protein
MLCTAGDKKGHMAQRVVLHYIPGHSLLHRWDARCKLLALFLITLTLLSTSASWLVANSTLLLGLILLSRLPLKRCVSDLKAWGVFLFVIFVFQALFTPGDPLFVSSSLPVTREGVYFGSFACWRFSLMLGYGVLFTAITRPKEVQDALAWFLRPVPLIPARRIGFMVSLALRFFSVILDQAEEIRLAHKARFGDRRRNPFRRARSLALPLLRRSLSRSEEVTLALAARGYRDDIPVRVTRMPLSHLIPVLILGLLIVLGSSL